MNKYMNDIQKLIDETSYPQNYYYDIETLQPKGLFEKRFNFFQKNTPELFDQYSSFLDIGCSLGYFLFFHAKTSEVVVGIEPDEKAFNICNAVKQFKKNDNIQLINSVFRDYYTLRKFELIFIGNAFHYLYRDEGWKVIERLSTVSKNFIVLEFPLEGKHLVEIGGWKDDDLTKDFTEKRFKEEVENYFEVVRISESGTIGERKNILLKKRSM